MRILVPLGVIVILLLVSADPAAAQSRSFQMENPALTPEEQADLDSAPENLPCRTCASCTVACAMGFAVRERILDIARVREPDGPAQDAHRRRRVP